MTEPAAVFKILDDNHDGVGVALDKVVDGLMAASGVKGLAAGVFKDTDGNVVWPMLDNLGRIAITTQAGVPKSSRGAVSAGATGSAVPVATISLTPGKKYTNMSFTVACRQAALYQIVFNDNGSESVIRDVVLDAGQYTFGQELLNDEVTAGGTGTQELRIDGLNFDVLSALRASLSALEEA